MSSVEDAIKPQSSSVMPNPSLHAITVKIYWQNHQEENANSQKEAPSKSRTDFIKPDHINILLLSTPL
jgi:hypothetical protein